jgi:PAS domain S-box-containing protein
MPQTLRRTLPAWCVLAISLSVAAVAGCFSYREAVEDARNRFAREIGVVRQHLWERLSVYEQVLRGGVSVFHSWDEVSRDNWRRYVNNLRLPGSYPGIQAIGFAEVVPAAEKERHEQEIRRSGFPEYRIHPDGERETYTAIVYIEPFNWRNQRAFGFDMFSQPVRRAAMERARDTGEASLSGKVTLVQETAEAVQAGFLLYLPVYRTASPATVDERRREVVGYVYSPFRMDDLMRRVLGDAHKDVGLEIFDGSATDSDALMYRNAGASGAGSAAFLQAPFEFGGHVWTLRFFPPSSLKVDWRMPLLVLGGGALISLLLWSITWSLARNRVEAAAANERLRADIARRELVEARLRDQEASFRHLFEKNPSPMWLYDLESLNVLEVNAAAAQHYGYARDEFRRLRITDLRPVEEVPRLLAHVRVRSLDHEQSGEWRHRTKDGRLIDVQISSYRLEHQNRKAALVVALDVTEMKRAEEAIRESEAAARGVLDASLDAYVRMDLEGRITGWNAAAERMFGWPRAEAIGRDLADAIVPPDQRGAHRAGLARFLANGEAALLDRRVELRGRHRSGREFPLEATIVPVSTARELTFSAFLRDLTEKTRADAQLRQAQKMEAVGRLTGGLAHDFNNLLTVVIGNLELAADPAGCGDETATLLAHALTAAEKGAALTHRLLAFSRQQTLQPSQADLGQMAEGMAELLSRTLGEDIEIEFRSHEGLWPALADKSQVESALLNLAINARDAMPAGGKLTIEAANVVLDAGPELQPGDYVMLAVTDTGVGMPAELIEQAVEPFFTTKEVGAGSGLGLSMVYGFAKQSGGHLRIYSEIGHGTTVRLYLPRAEAGQAAPSARPLEAAPLRGGETILVVEDDDAVRQLAVAHLQALGYRVLEASDGNRAVATLRGGEAVDLLFTDMVMPGGMTGRQLAEEARRMRPGIKVLFTSGYTQNLFAHQGGGDEGFRLLSKPYRRDELARILREVLDAR